MIVMGYGYRMKKGKKSLANYKDDLGALNAPSLTRFSEVTNVDPSIFNS
jgi:hypothetical protein